MLEQSADRTARKRRQKDPEPAEEIAERQRAAHAQKRVSTRATYSETATRERLSMDIN
jgi:hypothetical protein